MPIYLGRKFKVTYVSATTIEADMVKYANDPSSHILVKAYMDEWNYSGASAVPLDKVLDQRSRFFNGVHFRTIEELLNDAEKLEIV